MRENSIKDKWKEKELKDGVMEDCMKVNTQVVQKKGLEHLIGKELFNDEGQMEISILGIGNTINNMELEYLLTKKRRARDKDNGITVKE
jgi:hypothetical protein